MARDSVTFIAQTLLALACLFAPRVAESGCNIIPGVVRPFRAAQGAIDRPYATPNGIGRLLTISLGACDEFSTGLVDLDAGATPVEDDYFVSVFFTPPEDGPVNVVVLTTAANHGLCLARIAESPTLPGGGQYRCEPVEGGTQQLQIPIPTRVIFRFPDTDAFLAPGGDRISLSGPVRIAVTPVADALPTALASNRCADVAGTVVCVGELYTNDGTCETGADHLNPVFAHFTALPHANEFGRLCNEVEALRFTVDTAGNVLIPMDWEAALVDFNDIPTPRVVRAVSEVPAFSDDSAPARVPSRSFLGSYSPYGRRLPPIFDLVTDTTDPSRLSLFGSIDVKMTVLRIARRAPDLSRIPATFHQCAGGANAGSPCSGDRPGAGIDDQPDECPGSVCASATCHTVAGADMSVPCSVDADCFEGEECGPSLFDFTDRFHESVGPIIVQPPDFAVAGEGIAPLDGQASTQTLTALVELEPTGSTQTCSGIKEPGDLNGDGDATDAVVVVRDRATGMDLAMGEDRGAAVDVRAPPFRYFALAAENDLVAFLEPEPLQGDCSIPLACDENGDGDVFDTILRVYRRNSDCGGSGPCLTELEPIPNVALAADAEPVIDDRPLVWSDGILFYRIREASAAMQYTEWVSDHTRVSPPGIFWGGDGPLLTPDDRFAVWNPFSADSLYGTKVFFKDRHASGPEAEPMLVSPENLSDTEQVWAGRASVSGDGQRIAYPLAIHEGLPGTQELVPPWNAVVDDRTTGTRTVMSVGHDGSAADGDSGTVYGSPKITENGRYVAFTSKATNLVPDDTNGVDDVFLYDLEGLPGSRLTRVSVATDGTQGDGPSGIFGIEISGDGRYIAFDSVSSTLDPLEDRGFQQIYVHDQLTGTTELVSKVFDEATNAEIAADNNSFEPAISADGRYVSFVSFASNLVDAPSDRMSMNAYVYDRMLGLTERVSLRSDGGFVGTPNNVTRGTSLSGDGRYVSFLSDADDFVDDDTNNFDAEGIVHDRVTGLTARVTLNSDGTQPQESAPSNGEWVVNVRIAPSGNYTGFGHEARVAGVETGDELFHVYLRGPDPTDPLGADYFPDGRLDDTVLQCFDAKTLGAVAVSLGPAVGASVSGGSAAFLRPELADGVDRNSDGDLKDKWVFLSEDCAPAVDLDREAIDLALSSVALAALDAPESGGTLHAYDRIADEWVEVQEFVDDFAIDDSTVAFRSAVDARLSVYDTATATLAPLSLSAVDFVADAGVVAFRVPEQGPGAFDYNADGDLDDRVMHVFHVASGRVFNTGQAAQVCRSDACDPSAPYQIANGSVKFTTAEVEQGGTDLDGDGSTDGLVLQTFNVAEALAMEPLARRRVEPASSCAEPIDAVAHGVCADDGTPCAFDADCGLGVACFVPPGTCSRPTGQPCTPCGACKDSGRRCTVNADCGGSDPRCLVPPETCGEPAIGACTQCTGANEFCFRVSESPGCFECRVVIPTPPSCGSDLDCIVEDPEARCGDASSDVIRLISPLERTGEGELVLLTAREPIATDGDLCDSNADCSGEVCGEAGRCQSAGLRLAVAGDPDSDRDGVTDGFDNCPFQANPAQEDADSDCIGDICDREPCLALGGCRAAGNPTTSPLCDMCVFLLPPAEVKCSIDRDCQIPVLLDPDGRQLDVTSAVATVTSDLPISCAGICEPGAAAPDGWACDGGAPGSCEFAVGAVAQPFETAGAGEVARIDIKCTEPGQGKLCLPDVVVGVGPFAVEVCETGCGDFECVDCVSGDCSNDGWVRINDAICTMACISGPTAGDTEGFDCTCAADCNCQRGAEISDAICVIKRILDDFPEDPCDLGPAGALRSSPDGTGRSSVRLRVREPRTIANGTRARVVMALRGRSAPSVAGLHAWVATDGGGDVGRIRLSRRLRRAGFELTTTALGSRASIAILPPARVPIAAIRRGKIVRIGLPGGPVTVTLTHSQFGSVDGLPIDGD